MSTFHHNSPRPPVVPGEETGVSSTSLAVEKTKIHNPALTPRTSSLYRNANHDETAPLGFEPEGKVSSPEGELAPSVPAFLLWARNLSWLLSSADGTSLFRTYLMQEGQQHADHLDFWFACEGLRKEPDPEKMAKLVKVIHRRFFLKNQLGIADPLRKAVHKRVKDSSKPLDANVFDAAQSEVEKLITETTYPNFLRSDIYLNYVQSMQNGPNSWNGPSGGGSGSSGSNQATLATLHEDKELDTTSEHTNYPPLTKDMLIMTQSRRVDLRPKPEAFAGVFLHGKPGVKAYSSYNPVSRQDSELQSLSSDARTESDNLSLTDTSIDGMSLGNHRMTRKQYYRHCQQVKEAASLNRDPNMHQTVIPRTQRLQKEQVHPMKPEEFAAILIDKLETVKRNQEAQEKLAQKLFEGDGMEGSVHAESLAEAIRERFQIEDDNDQAILDQHVSRVWSDQTPARTPGIVSPHPKSPDMLRRNRPPNQGISKVCVSSGGPALAPHMSMTHSVPHPYQTRPYPRHIRKDKDVFSTFSSDSGNVHDIESLDFKLHIPKSKSVPDYAESSDIYSSLSSHDPRLRQSREWCNSSRRYNKKPELTDSGVSVVSETVSHHGFQCKERNDYRVLSWLKENESMTCCSHSDCSCSTASSRFEAKHHTKPNPPRGRRSPPPGPGQPFVADPSMPPLPSPHTPTQLEEARRRLEDQARLKQTRQRCQPGKVETSLSGGSTLRRRPPSETHTTVVFSFCDEQFPYRSKIPGQSVTLKQFKEFLPKKGNYRYFFKTECDELDMKVIQEEITDDSEVLPLWEGKVMAQVKPVD